MPTRRELEAACTPRTRAVLINTPGNPTGAVFPSDAIEDVLEFARDHDLYVISDEVYAKIVYDRPFVSAWGHGEDDRVIVANSVSKTYSMTGWRLGWALASRPRRVDRQAAGGLHLLQPDALSEGRRSGAQRRSVVHRHIPRRLSAATSTSPSQSSGGRASPAPAPAGSFYLWLDVGCEDSWAFADRLLDERHVAVAPGEAFGDQGKGRVRLSLASSEDQVRRGARELGEFCREIRDHVDLLRRGATSSRPAWWRSDSEEVAR